MRINLPYISLVILVDDFSKSIKASSPCGTGSCPFLPNRAQFTFGPRGGQDSIPRASASNTRDSREYIYNTSGVRNRGREEWFNPRSTCPVSAFNRSKETYYEQKKCGEAFIAPDFIAKLVYDIVRSEKRDIRLWDSLKGSMMIFEAMNKHRKSTDRIVYIKGAIMLCSSIIKRLRPADAEKFIQRIRIREVFPRHSSYIGKYIRKEFADNWFKRPFENLTEIARKRAAYTYSPFWLIDRIEPSLLNEVKLRQIVFLQKYYRNLVLHGYPKPLSVRISASSPLENAVETIMKVSPNQARNLKIRYAGRDLFKDLMDELVKGGFFARGSEYSTFSISPEVNVTEENLKIFRAIGRFIGICLAWEVKIGLGTLPKSMYAVVINRETSSRYSRKEFKRFLNENILRSMESFSEGFKDIITVDVGELSVEDIRHVLHGPRRN